MPIEFRCDCGSLLRVPDRLAGKTVRCPGCSEPTLVPRIGEDPASYPLAGTLPSEEDLLFYSLDELQELARQPPEKTYQNARSAKHSLGEAKRTVQPKRLPQSPWLDSLTFPIRDENKFVFAGWSIGFVLAAVLLSVPIPFVVALACQLFILLVGAGFFFHFLSEVIRTAAAGEQLLPETSFGEEVFFDAIHWWGAIILGFAPWWAFHLFQWWFQAGLPSEIGYALLFVAVLYTPMALLATTLFNSLLAANPVYVLGAIAKLPVQYLACCFLSATILVAYAGLRALLSSVIGPTQFFLIFTANILSSLVLLYASIVVMHQLGSIYYRNRAKIGWFRE